MFYTYFQELISVISVSMANLQCIFLGTSRAKKIRYLALPVYTLIERVIASRGGLATLEIVQKRNEMVKS